MNAARLCRLAASWLRTAEDADRHSGDHYTAAAQNLHDAAFCPTIYGCGMRFRLMMLSARVADFGALFGGDTYAGLIADIEAAMADIQQVTELERAA